MVLRKRSNLLRQYPIGKVNHHYKMKIAHDEKAKMRLTSTQRTANMGFAKMGADGSRVSTFCFSIWLHIQLDVINLAMCKSSTFIYKFSFS